MLRKSTSPTLFRKSNDSINLIDWNEKFIDAGCNKELIDYVMKEKIILDYENLFNTFSKLPPNFKNAIQYPWQLYCLSGEKEAFDKVIESHNEYVKKIEKKIDKYNEDINLLKHALQTEDRK